jgi:hypothetical protein
MKTIPIGMSLLLLCVSVQLGAGDFWQSKPYTQWTSEDVLTILKESPWAKDTTTKIRKVKSEDDPQSTDSQRLGINRGVNGGVGATTGLNSGTPDMSGTPDPRVTVRWDSALPVRQALSKQGSAASADKPVLEGEPPSYIVTVADLPRAGEYMGGMVAAAVNRLDQLVAATSITIKGKPALTPEKVEHGRDGTSLLFTFPRTSPISLDDKEVEFVTRIGAMEVRRKFKLKDMVFQGKLAL